MQLPPRDDDWQRSGQVSLLILSQRNKCTYVFHRLLQCNRPNCASAAHTLFSRKKKEAGKAPKRHSKRQQPGNIIMMVCLCFYLWPIILYVLADRENIPTMFCSSELWLCFLLHVVEKSSPRVCCVSYVELASSKGALAHNHQRIIILKRGCDQNWSLTREEKVY